MWVSRSRRSSSVIGTITSNTARGRPKVSNLATSVSAKRLNWTSLNGLMAGITRRRWPICSIGYGNERGVYHDPPGRSAGQGSSSSAEPPALDYPDRRRPRRGRPDRDWPAARGLVPASGPGDDRTLLY